MDPTPIQLIFAKIISQIIIIMIVIIIIVKRKQRKTLNIYFIEILISSSMGIKFKDYCC